MCFVCVRSGVAKTNEKRSVGTYDGKRLFEATTIQVFEANMCLCVDLKVSAGK